MLAGASVLSAFIVFTFVLSSITFSLALSLSFFLSFSFFLSLSLSLCPSLFFSDSLSLSWQIRRTVSRMLVLAVSLGYGVVRPDLGKSKIRVIIYGIAYLVLAGALEVVVEGRYAVCVYVFPLSCDDGR